MGHQLYASEDEYREAMDEYMREHGLSGTLPSYHPTLGVGLEYMREHGLSGTLPSHHPTLGVGVEYMLEHGLSGTEE